ncbi:MAG: hypothetical protein K2N51_14390 [Lachnospiraceae bacterium]|nr:hypothetical protein [Lachnospiraceae bacterium]
MKNKTGLIFMLVSVCIIGIVMFWGQNKSYSYATEVAEDNFEETEEDYLDEMEEDYSLEAVSLKYDAYVENFYNNIIKITNLKTKQSTTMEIKDELKLGNCIDEVLWINDTTLAVIMHANPSLSVLFVIDADKEKILYTKYGSAFTWVDDNPESLLYVEQAPHFSEVTGYEEIKNYEDDTLLQTGEEEQIVGFDISQEDDTVAYVINDKKDKETVYFADYKKKEKKLKTTKKEKLKKKKNWFRWGKDGYFYAESPENTTRIKYKK